MGERGIVADGPPNSPALKDRAIGANYRERVTLLRYWFRLTTATPPQNHLRVGGDLPIGQNHAVDLKLQIAYVPRQPPTMPSPEGPGMEYGSAASLTPGRPLARGPRFDSSNHRGAYEVQKHPGWSQGERATLVLLPVRRAERLKRLIRFAALREDNFEVEGT